MSIDEFLAFERAADRKHEFVDSCAYAWGDQAVGLAGANRRHNRVLQRIAAQLENAAEAAGCDVFGPDMPFGLATPRTTQTCSLSAIRTIVTSRTRCDHV